MQDSSRFGRPNVTVINAGATSWTTKIGKETYQVRCATAVPSGIWYAAINSTSVSTDFLAGTSTSSSSTIYFGSYLPPNWVEYATVTPGQIIVFASTSTSTNYTFAVTEVS